MRRELAIISPVLRDHACRHLRPAHFHVLCAYGGYAMKTLPFDIARCAGRFDLMPDGKWCPERDTCKRYLAFTQWDRGVVESYQGMRVNMAAPDCRHKIEVEQQ